MVDAPQTQTNSSEKPFAAKATFFTIVFLVLILGAIPSIFYVAERWEFGSKQGFFEQVWFHAKFFWPVFLKLIGISVFAAGLVAYLACSAWLIFFGKGPHVEFDPPKVFVATGPYRWVRNPVVLALLVTVVGEALYFASWGILVLVLLGIGFAHWQVTCMEEPRLKKRFGESYEDFCRRVPRWIPRPPTDD